MRLTNSKNARRNVKGIIFNISLKNNGVLRASATIACCGFLVIVGVANYTFVVKVLQDTF